MAILPIGFPSSVCANERGFSTLEVMTVIIIIGITAAIAVPNYVQWNRTYQLRQAATDLQSSLSLARMAAMNRNTTVTMTLGMITCPPETVYCGLNGASFGGVIWPVPLQDRNVTATLTPGPNVQFTSLGLLGGGVGADQIVRLINVDALTYSIVITQGGKVRWCAAITCK
jgi:prepilin-type N-terminal cleavage/methylation domain-containing protein